MACPRCTAARQAASSAVRSIAAGKLTEAAVAARHVVDEVAAKVAESDRIRSLTCRKPNG